MIHSTGLAQDCTTLNDASIASCPTPKNSSMTIPTIHRLEPAFSVLERLGGKSSVAAELDVAASTLSRWCQPVPAGTGGLIPQRHWGALLELAKKLRVELTISDLASV